MSRIQREDVKTLAQLLAAGGNKDQLIQDVQLYISSFGIDKTIAEGIQEGWIEPKNPLKIAAALIPDSKLYITSTYVQNIDGTKKVLPSMRKKVLNVPDSTIDFQDHSTTGATFVIDWPTTGNTVGHYRLMSVCYTFDGNIECLFSDDSATLGGLPDADTLFVPGSMPVGWVILECTHAGNGYFKTAGSATSIIENAPGGTTAIYRIATGGIGGGGSGVYTQQAITLADTEEIVIGHGLNTPIANLKTIIRQSTTYLSEGVKNDYFTFTAIDDNSFSVTNASGSSKTFDIVVLGFKPGIVSGTSPATLSQDLDPDFDISFIQGAYTKDPTGLDDHASVNIVYSPTARTFTLTPTGPSFTYRVKGIKHTFTATQVTTPHAATTGKWFCEIDVNGAFQVGNSGFDFENRAMVDVAVYDTAQTPLGFGLNEKHGTSMPWAVHLRLHDSPGTVLKSGGTLTAGTYTEYAPTTTPAAIPLAQIQPGVDSCIILDEDNRSTLAALLEATGYTTIRKDWTANKWIWAVDQVAPYYQNGSNVPQYNPSSGGANLAVVPSGSYFCTYVAAVPADDGADNQKFRFIFFPGQQVYTATPNNSENRTSAQALAMAEDPSLIDLATFLPPEFVLIGKIVAFYDPAFYNVDPLVGNVYSLRIDGYQKIVGSRTNMSVLSGVSVSIHNNLSNRDAEQAHPAPAIQVDATAYPANDLFTSTVQALDTLLTSVATKGIARPAVAPADGKIPIFSNSGKSLGTSGLSVANDVEVSSATYITWNAPNGVSLGNSSGDVSLGRTASGTVLTQGTPNFLKPYLNLNTNSPFSSAGLNIYEMNTSGTTEALYGISCTPYSPGQTRPLYAVGGSGKIITTLTGNAWLPQSSGTSVTLRGIHTYSNLVSWMCGDNGTILKTTDGGATWVAQTSGTTANLHSIRFYSTSTGYAVGDGGVIRRTLNGGTTWSAGNNADTSDLKSVYCMNNIPVYACGASGVILKSDNGLDFTVQTSGVTETLNALFFTDNNTGFAVGNNHTVLVTFNGITWQNNSAVGGVDTLITNINSVYMVTSNSVFLCGDSGKILYTVNGGYPWNLATTPAAVTLRDIAFFTSAIGFAVGDSGAIFYTTNSGVTWSSVSGTSSIKGKIYFEGSILTGVTSKWVCGDETTQHEILTTLHSQTFANKRSSTEMWFAKTVANSLVSDPDGYIPITARADSRLYCADNTYPNVPLPIGESDFYIKWTGGNNVYIKGGSLRLSNGDMLVSGNGFTYASSTVGAYINHSLTFSSLGSSTWYIYIDRYTLGAPQTLTDSGQRIIPVLSANFVALTTSPEVTNPYRYIAIGWAKAAAGVFNSIFGTAPTKSRDLMSGVFAIPQVASVTYSTTGVKTFTHNLAGEPQSIYLSFFDASTAKKYALDVASYVTDKNSGAVWIDLAGLTFESGDYVELKCIYLPTTGDQVASVSNRYESAWLTSTAVTTLAHGLTNMDDIRSYCVIEWDNTNPVLPVRRLIDPSALINYFDNTNFYLDFASITPSSTLMYKVISSGTPLPSALPTYMGGYTKFIGGAGGYSSIAAAFNGGYIQPGDSILVLIPTQINTADLNLNISNIRMDFMPNCPITFIGDWKINLTGSNVEMRRLEMVATVSVANCLYIAADDCYINNSRVKSTSGTVAAAYAIASGTRNYIDGKVVASGGAITNKITYTALLENDFNIRG